MKIIILMITTIITLTGFSAFSEEVQKCEQNLADEGDIGALVACENMRYQISNNQLTEIYNNITYNLKIKESESKLIKLLEQSNERWLKDKKTWCDYYFVEAKTRIEEKINGYSCYNQKTNERIDILLKEYGIMGYKKLEPVSNFSP